MSLLALFLVLIYPLEALSAQPASCRMEFRQVQPKKALPGDAIRLTGSWGAPAKWKWPSLNKGSGRELKVLGWSDNQLDLQIPEDAAPGSYRLGVYCAWGGQLFASDWKNFEVLPKDSVRSSFEAPLMGSPGFSSADYGVQPQELGAAFCGEAQRHWMTGQYEPGEQAAAQAWEAYHTQGDTRGMAMALYWRALHREYLGKKADAARDRRMALDILEYFIAQDAPDRAGRPAAISDYCNVLDGLFRAALEERDFNEARRLADKRLELYIEIKDFSGQTVAQGQKEQVLKAEKDARQSPP